MNYIDFINSKDERKYLKSIGYKPGLLESAFFIYTAKKRTLKEKHEAWISLVQETEDLILDENAGWRWGKDKIRQPLTYGLSAHDLIKRFIDEERIILDYFNNDEDKCVYIPSFRRLGTRYVGEARPSYYDMEAGLYFGCKDDAIRYCHKEIEEDPEIESYYVSKHLFSNADDNRSSHVTTYYDRTGELMSVDIVGGDNAYIFPTRINEIVDPKDKFFVDYDFFERMWFDIPTPFKKGDVVHNSINRFGSSEPFILMGIDPWRRKEERNIPREGSDSSDMIAYGWSIGFGDDPTKIDDDIMVDYLNLEYYTEEYKGVERLLPLLSEQIKGNIDIWEWELLKNEIIRTSSRELRTEGYRSHEILQMIINGKNDQVVFGGKDIARDK